MNPANKPVHIPDNSTVLIGGNAQRELVTIEYSQLVAQLVNDLPAASTGSAGLLTPEQYDVLQQLPIAQDLFWLIDIAKHEHVGVIAARAPAAPVVGTPEYLRIPFATYLRTNRAKIVRIVARCDDIIVTAVTTANEFPVGSLWRITQLASGAQFNSANVDYYAEDDGTPADPRVGDVIRVVNGLAPDSIISTNGSGSTHLRLIVDHNDPEDPLHPIKATVQVLRDDGSSTDLYDGGSKEVNMSYGANPVDISLAPLHIRADMSIGRADEILVTVANTLGQAVVNPRVTILLEHDFNALTTETS